MMENFVESVEYYYDEDFSIPFDIGISEENNNSNTNQEYTYFRWMDIIGCEETDKDNFYNDEFDLVTVPENIFSQTKASKNDSKFENQLQMKQSYNIDVKRAESTQSAVRMSCSSSPNSCCSNTNNVCGYSRPNNDSFVHNMSFIESNYSLKSRVPLLNQSNKNILANYHLHFAPGDSFITSSVHPYDCKLSLRQDYISSQITDTDSGKCSSATFDNFFVMNRSDDPMTKIQGFNTSSHKQLKPEAVLWRQIKYLMLYHLAGWNLFRLLKQFRKKKLLSKVANDDIVICSSKNSTQRSKRYSCSVLEIYNSICETEKSFSETVKVLNTSNPVKNLIHNVSCQFPPKNRRKVLREHSNPTKIQNQAYDYPGIGKLSMPKQTRLNASVFLSSKFDSHLSFLQTSLTNQSDTTYNRMNNTTTEKNQNTESPKSMCNLHCHSGCENTFNYNSSLKPCLRKDEESPEKKEVTLRSRSRKLIAATENFKRKSVSFDCPRMATGTNVPEMREIPRKWGLLGSEAKSSSDMLAIFECGRRDSLLGYTGIHDSYLAHDDATRFRDMVNDVLRAVKHISDRLTTTITNDKTCSTDPNKTFHSRLLELCELICNGDGLDSPLATAIDNLITLFSDGLVVASFSSKKVVRLSTSAGTGSSNKAAMRLWLLIEETCRVSASSSSTGRKSELSQLLREVRQSVLACHSLANSKDHHVRLRSFIANALKSGLLHVWMRSVVSNDSALQRFYCPEAFIRQARTGQSDALAALTVSLKTLTIGIEKPGLPPPVKISRRFLPSPTSSQNSLPRLLQKPNQGYCEENTESDSYADESRSSQSEFPQNCNNNNNNNQNGLCAFSRAATHPRFVRKSTSTSANLNPTAFDSTGKHSPFRNLKKSPSNYSCNAMLTRANPVVSIPLKTVRTVPLSSKLKAPKPDSTS